MYKSRVLLTPEEVRVIRGLLELVAIQQATLVRYIKEVHGVDLTEEDWTLDIEQGVIERVTHQTE